MRDLLLCVSNTFQCQFPIILPAGCSFWHCITVSEDDHNFGQIGCPGRLPSLANAEFTEDCIQYILCVNDSCDFAQSVCSSSELLCCQIRLLPGVLKAQQGLYALLYQLPMPQPAQHQKQALNDADAHDGNCHSLQSVCSTSALLCCQLRLLPEMLKAQQQGLYSLLYQLPMP